MNVYYASLGHWWAPLGLQGFGVCLNGLMAFNLLYVKFNFEQNFSRKLKLIQLQFYVLGLIGKPKFLRLVELDKIPDPKT